MTWLRFDPDYFWSLDVVERMDLDAAGLLLWLVSRSWRTGAIRDDPAHYKAMLRGKCKGFDRLWPIVREAFEEADDGLRIAWVEEERETASRRLTGDAARQALQRTKRGQSRVSHTGVTRDSCVSHASTDGRDGRDGRTDNESGVADSVDPKPEVEAWFKIFEQFPTLNRHECHAAYRRWIECRRASKLKQYTAIGLRTNLAKFEPHGPAAFCAAVDESISNGWQGVFPPRGSASAATSRPGSIRGAIQAQRATQARPEAQEVPHADVR